MLAVAGAIPFSPNAAAQDVILDPAKTSIGKREYSPYLTKGFPDRVYFGDTHLHTSYSTDAGMFGTRLGPDEAYRFARGEEVISNTGLRARLQRPLDFLVITDHAENLGLANMIAESNADLLRTSWGRTVHDLVKSGKGGDAYNAWGQAMIERIDPLKGNEALTRTMWERLTAAAEKYNDPGKFTALIGYEWSRRPTATTCTATSFSAMARQRPIRSFRSRNTTASIRRTCGRGWRAMSSRPAERSSPSHTMAICHSG